MIMRTKKQVTITTKRLKKGKKLPLLLTVLQYNHPTKREKRERRSKYRQISPTLTSTRARYTPESTIYNLWNIVCWEKFYQSYIPPATPSRVHALFTDIDIRKPDMG